MGRKKDIESLAKKIYLARHSHPKNLQWEDMEVVKSYKRTKYRQLAAAALDWFDQRQPKK